VGIASPHMIGGYEAGDFADKRARVVLERMEEYSVK
jgi:hypothetical protein